MWRAVPPDPQDVRLLQRVRERHDLHPLVIHCNYLANLATLSPDVRAQSITSFRGELDRAAAIGADYLVLHPGNHRGQSLEQGLAAFVLGLGEAARGFSAGNLTVLLENTVGSANQIGSRFEELRILRELAERETDLPLGYCLDTCHLLAAGFEITTEEGLNLTLAAVEQMLGLDRVRVIHANDSKGALGSHLDRHENIGRGKIGEEGFRRILNEPRLRSKPFILETEMDDDAQGAAEIATMKRLAERPSVPPPRKRSTR